jgi:pyruvate ferredoxin oxidoreductase beta subunit
MAKPVPVEKYLSMQGRFKGLSPKVIDEMRQQIELNLKRLAKEAEEVC